ncbi:MAG: adenylyltransferase, partial [Gammaproteobacteria bacterium]|nr:adenylyltransferase [Gammaproteobacteria bacterium]
GSRIEALKTESEQYPSLTLNPRQLCDLELLMNGGFSPLEGFMDQAGYQSVLKRSRLPSGELWPIPVVLDISQQLADTLSSGDKLALRDAEGFMLAVLTISDIWALDKRAEAADVYGTDDAAHPGVAYLYNETENVYLGGAIEGLQLPGHYDFEASWNSPSELREQFAKNGWRKVMAFQTSKPMHRLHREITLAAALEHGTHLLLHPTVGAPRPGDIPYHARVHCYKAVQKHYPKHLTKLSLLPLAIRMAGPRDALLSCIVHQNYGCSHYMVGPNEGAPPDLEQNRNWYGVTEAQELVSSHQSELQIQIGAGEEHGYSPSKDRFEPRSLLKHTAGEEERFDESSV